MSLVSSVAAYLGLCGIVAAAAGCAYRTPTVHVPAPMPALSPAALDVSVTTVNADQKQIEPAVADEVHRQASAILLKAARARGAEGAPARVRVQVRLEDSYGISDSMRQDGCAVFAYAFAPLGQVTDREKLSVEVAVETGGRTYTGRGRADKMGGIYASARRRALAAALDEALADASR
ncbi:MAG: hypothetical protein HY898_32545 [Deltaproteobacteria bacterium]|nr:hypothetical protein [Deltaproteobacteria bacterium]